jgi:hypothetical protein
MVFGSKSFREIFVLSAPSYARVPAPECAAIEDYRDVITNGPSRKKKLVHSVLPTVQAEIQAWLKTGDWNGGRYRIRTYDFHRVKMALYR